MRTRFPAPSALLAALALLAAPASAADPNPAFDPKPAEGDLSLPMPGGLKMVFRPVFLGVGAKDFAGKQITLGDRDKGGYKENPTTVVIGGSFVKEPAAGAEPDWMYYIGKYEVSAAQFAAVMSPAVPPAEGRIPAVNITLTEVRQFLAAYNRWLYDNAPDALPKNEGRSGYLRLPTEAEWEFAARGGSAVAQDVFDLTHPYGKSLGRYEWFSGQRSSYDKIQKIGVNKPNPLGIHDLLGNVSEMTDSLYQVEYIQGRIGGFVVRGGTFLTLEKNMRASLRVEADFYNDKLQERKQGDLGFRLVIGSPIYASNQTLQRLETAWEEYRPTRPVIVITAGGIPKANTNFKLDDAVAALKRLEAEIGRAGTATPEAVSQLGLLKSSFADVESLIRKAEEDSANSWTRMASHTAALMTRELKKLPEVEQQLERLRASADADKIERWETILGNLKANIHDAEERYCDILQELGKINPDQVRKGFGLFEKYLIKKSAEGGGAGLKDQILYHRIAVSQYEEYARSKRLNLEAWREQLVQPKTP